MNDSDRNLVLGIDGGGTRTRAVLAEVTSPAGSEQGTSSDDARILGRGEAAGSNPQTVGWEAATQHLADAIESCFQNAGISRCPVKSACLGVAGTDRFDDEERLEQWATDFSLAEKTRVTNDALPVLYAGNPAGVGIAVISGTGSFAIARTDDDITFRCGGWGPLFGDEGSGYWIAVEALRAAAWDADSRGPHTELLPQILLALGLEESFELVTAIYEPSMDRASIARLASIVFTSATNGDDVAREILKQARAELVHLIVSAAETFSEGETVPLVLSGGVLLNQPEFTDEVVWQAQQRCPQLGSDSRISDAAPGTLAMAIEWLGSDQEY